jgi:hypothetical protein
MPCQVKTSSHYQLRNVQKNTQDFSIVSLPTDSAIVDHAVFEKGRYKINL